MPSHYFNHHHHTASNIGNAPIDPIAVGGHNSLFSPPILSSVPVTSSTATNNTSASNPLLAIMRGGTGLHRCDICECCMTAGAMAQHQSGRKHLRRLMAIANGTVKPSSSSSSPPAATATSSNSPPASSNGKDEGDNRVVAWRRFHHCTDCNLWLYWREKERHENGARHRATVAAKSSQQGSPSSASGAAGIPSHDNTSTTTSISNGHESIAIATTHHQYTHGTTSPGPAIGSGHMSVSHPNHFPSHREVMMPNWNETSSPHDTDDEIDSLDMPHPHHRHHAATAAHSPVQQVGGAGMAPFLSFVHEYDSSAHDGWSLFSNDWSNGSTPTHSPPTSNRGASSSLPTTASTSAPSSPLTYNGSTTHSPAPAPLNTRHSAPASTLAASMAASTSSFSRQHVRRSASSDSVAVPAPLSSLPHVSSLSSSLSSSHSAASSLSTSSLPQHWTKSNQYSSNSSSSSNSPTHSHSHSSSPPPPSSTSPTSSSSQHSVTMHRSPMISHSAMWAPPASSSSLSPPQSYSSTKSLANLTLSTSATGNSYVNVNSNGPVVTHRRNGDLVHSQPQRQSSAHTHTVAYHSRNYVH